MTIKSTISAALAALTLAFATPLAAQEPVTPSDITAEQVTDEQVIAFVEALSAIEEVRAEYSPKIQAEESEEDRQAMIDQADAAAIEAVEKVKNITPADYLGIGKAAQEDDALNQRIIARIKEVQAE